MKVLALVIDFNSHDDAARLTLQLAGSTLDGHELTVVHVDNASQTAHCLSEAQLQRGVKLLRNPNNKGYAEAIRQALSRGHEGFDAYWFLNCDLEVEPDSFQKLIQALDRNPTAGAVGPTVFKGKDRSKVWGARGAIYPGLGLTAMSAWPSGGVLPRWSYIPGSSILVRAEAYWQVGGLSDRYGMYYEETELCVNLQKKGWDLRVVPDAAAYHHVASMADRIPARHFAYFFTRNNLYFWKQCFGIPPVIQFPRMLFVVFKEIVLPLRRAPSLSVAKDRLTYVLRGVLDSFPFLRDPKTRHDLFR